MTTTKIATIEFNALHAQCSTCGHAAGAHRGNKCLVTNCKAHKGR